MYVVGTDENGMGPRLGPMIATGACLEVSRYRPAHLHALGVEFGVDDSKATAAFGRVTFAESLALALAARELGRTPTHADELLDVLSLDSVAALQEPCSGAALSQCWTPLALPCFGGDVVEGERVLAALARRGVHVRRVRTTLACVFELNRRLREGQSRVDVDLAQFERLVLDARAAVGEDVRAVCGMVGGIRKYPARFRHFAAEDVKVVREVRGRCSYSVRGVGQVAFEVDADAQHLPVALASMVGKYVRELAVERQNRFYRAHDESLPHASGYHDPVTRRFVEQSSGVRRRLSIADDCFERATARS